MREKREKKNWGKGSAMGIHGWREVKANARE